MLYEFEIQMLKTPLYNAPLIEVVVRWLLFDTTTSESHVLWNVRFKNITIVE
jgi:hypothetical protein